MWDRTSPVNSDLEVQMIWFFLYQTFVSPVMCSLIDQFNCYGSTLCDGIKTLTLKIPWTSFPPTGKFRLPTNQSVVRA